MYFFAIFQCIIEWVLHEKLVNETCHERFHDLYILYKIAFNIEKVNKEAFVLQISTKIKKKPLSSHKNNPGNPYATILAWQKILRSKIIIRDNFGSYCCT